MRGAGEVDIQGIALTRSISVYLHRALSIGKGSTLAHDIVNRPEALKERVDDYLKQLRETESCAI